MDRETLKKELEELCYLYGDLLKRSRINTEGIDVTQHYAEKYEKKKEELLDKILENE